MDKSSAWQAVFHGSNPGTGRRRRDESGESKVKRTGPGTERMDWKTSEVSDGWTTPRGQVASGKRQCVPDQTNKKTVN